MSRRVPILLTVLVTLLALVASSAAAKSAPRYYLALGDSLSQGMQPDTAGVTRDTSEGYTDDLAAYERGGIRGLKLVKLGCGGESTHSMLTGKGNEAAAHFLHCHRTGGSQLKAAEAFLRAHHHRGEVPLLTVDIGANDVDGCATAKNIGQCVVQGLASIKHNLPLILSALRKAAPAGTKLAAMTLYDPVLAAYFSSDPKARALASASVGFLKSVNQELTDADHNAHFLTADVAGTFKSYDSTDKVTWEGQQIPVNVAYVCSWTWGCQTPPSGPNIHANKNGYLEIAGAFEKVIGKLR